MMHLLKGQRDQPIIGKQRQFSMVDAEYVQQESVKAEVSKAILNQIRKAIIRGTIIELETGWLGSNPG